MALPGAARHTARLRRIASRQVVQRIGQALFEAGKLIEVEAKRSITAGSVSGKNHVPSLPGQPPNQDLGGLTGNIETTQPAPLRVLVASNAPYARALEEGTSKVAARPYMSPAAKKKRGQAVEYVRAVIKREIGS
jgi:HK97 gp10 family phage protein